MPENGYTFTSDQFAQLLIARFFPEKTDHETALLKDYLRAHLHELAKVTFSVKVGPGLEPDPSHPAAVQRNTRESSRRRIDAVVWRGDQPIIVEAKTRISHEVMGQLLMNRQLWLEDNPGAPEPELIAIGRRGAPADIGVLNANGITVFIYETESESVR